MERVATPRTWQGAWPAMVPGICRMPSTRGLLWVSGRAWCPYSPSSSELHGPHGWQAGVCFHCCPASSPDGFSSCSCEQEGKGHLPADSELKLSCPGHFCAFQASEGPNLGFAFVTPLVHFALVLFLKAVSLPSVLKAVVWFPR